MGAQLVFQLSFRTMVRMSVLNDAFKNMTNAERRGKRQVMIRPGSKVIVKFLQVMQKHGYIGEFEIVDDHRSQKIVVELNGRLNKCGVISPRFDFQAGDAEKWIANLLPSRQSGTSCSPPPRVLWATTRLAASKLVARSLVSSIKACTGRTEKGPIRSFYESTRMQIKAGMT